MNETQPLTKPGQVTAIAVMTLVNGILNILTAIGLTATIVLGTFGVGLLCAPITITPAILGIFEILYAVKILPTPIQRGTKPATVLAILEICCILFGNIISLVIGILSLVFYNDTTVKEYYSQNS
jgi:hypothetical protein